MGQGHEGGAEDEHAELPHGLGEAGPQHSHRPELANQSHEETEKTNKHAELHPGVRSDLLGKAKTNFYRVSEPSLGLKITNEILRLLVVFIYLYPVSKSLH